MGRDIVDVHRRNRQHQVGLRLRGDTDDGRRAQPERAALHISGHQKTQTRRIWICEGNAGGVIALLLPAEPVCRLWRIRWKRRRHIHVKDIDVRVITIHDTYQLIGFNLPPCIVRSIRVLMVKVPHPHVFQMVAFELVFSLGLGFPVEGIQCAIIGQEAADLDIARGIVTGAFDA